MLYRVECEWGRRSMDGPRTLTPNVNLPIRSKFWRHPIMLNSPIKKSTCWLALPLLTSLTLLALIDVIIDIIVSRIYLLSCRQVAGLVIAGGRRPWAEKWSLLRDQMGRRWWSPHRPRREMVLAWGEKVFMLCRIVLPRNERRVWLGACTSPWS